MTIVIDHSNIVDMKPDAETISISEFKATCLARLERVRRTGRRLLVTKRGTPIAEVVPATRPPRKRTNGGSPCSRASF